VLILSLLVAPLAAAAQQAGKGYRVGVLVPFIGPATTLFSEVFRHELRELGYVEGQNLTLEYRSAEGSYERLPALAAELVGLPVDVLVTWSTHAALAAKHATSTLPVVFTAVADPILSGLVASFARPGGNITGVTHIPSELDLKRLELLTEVVPSATRIAVLWHPEFPPNVEGVPALQRAAQALRVELLMVAYRGVQDFEAALAAMRRDGATALFVMPHPTTSGHATRLAALAVTHHLPAMAPYREFAEAGGLLAYGARFADLYRRAAALVDKVLKGATPRDVPVERPTRFELVINRKTAQVIGLPLSPVILFRADEVLE
jgi:putative ABC transport system substrate-binding protein